MSDGYGRGSGFLPKPQQTQADRFYKMLYPSGQPGWWIGPQEAEPAERWRVEAEANGREAGKEKLRRV